MDNPKKMTADPAVPAPAPPTPVSPVPSTPPDPATVPKPPQGFIPPNLSDFRGYRPQKAELATTPDAILELRSFQDYADVFGKTAPPADQVIGALDLAYQWTQVLDPSQAWLVYTKAMDAMTWKSALVLLESLKAPFKLAVLHDPTLASRYPALVRLLSANKVTARKGVSTKKKIAHGDPVKSKAAKRTAAKKAAKAAKAAGQTGTPEAQPKPPTPLAEPSPPQPAGAAPAHS